MKKLFVFGGTGHIGQGLVREANSRGYTVVAAARDLASVPDIDGVTWQAVDASNPESVKAAVQGSVAVLASVSGRKSGHDSVPAIAGLLLDVLPEVDVQRLLWVGGAGTLEVAPGLQVIDTPDFPAEWKPEAQAQGEALAVFRDSRSSVNWTYFSPAALIEPGERTARYRVGDDDRLLVDGEGNSRISIEDFAVALIDEIDLVRYPRKRVNIAY